MVNAWQASYDPDGKMVWDSSGAYHVYGLNEKLLGTYTVSWNGNTPTVSMVSKWGYFNGKTIGRGTGSFRLDACGRMDAASDVSVVRDCKYG